MNKVLLIYKQKDKHHSQIRSIIHGIGTIRFYWIGFFISQFSVVDNYVYFENMKKISLKHKKITLYNLKSYLNNKKKRLKEFKQIISSKY